MTDNQMLFFLGEGFVITFQEREGDVFDPIRSRIREARGRIRTAGADYLLYALLDAVVDSVFPLIEGISVRLEDEEERILKGESDDPVIENLYEVRRELIMLRRALWPLREAIGHLMRVEGDRISEDTRVYLRDVADHAVQIVDLLESEREVVSTLMDVHLSQVSHKMNEVMKVLTIIATIFMPLGFLAGLYGNELRHGLAVQHARAPLALRLPGRGRHHAAARLGDAHLLPAKEVVVKR